MDIGISKTRNVAAIIIIAMLMAVIFDYLFFDKVIGISTFAFAVIGVGILWRLSVRFGYLYKSSLWLALPILFFALMPGVRANLFLNFLNVLAIGGLLLLGIRELLQEHISQFGVREYIQTIFLVPMKIIANSIKPLQFGLNQFRQSSTARWKRILIGIAMALPVLIIFTILFSSADLAFQQFVTSIFNIHLPDTFFGHVFVLFVIFTISLGILEYLFKLTGTINTVNEEKPTKETSGRELEIQVFLYLIATLFLVFIVFQITYLFGGDVNITNKGFTYAEYARKGFWELLSVASATLLILFITDIYTKREVSRKKWFTIPSTIIILEIFIIITSAFKRLMLYQEAYGMTALRFYVAGFILFLGVIFILLAIKFIYERKENFFAFGTLITIIAFLVGVNLINPDAFIARKNIEQFNKTGKIDVKYLTNLSADALPQILEILPHLSEEDRVIVEEALVRRKSELEEYKNWQSFNFSRSRALKELNQRF